MPKSYLCFLTYKTLMISKRFMFRKNKKRQLLTRHRKGNTKNSTNSDMTTE